jgi:hypothetical protein
LTSRKYSPPCYTLALTHNLSYSHKVRTVTHHGVAYDWVETGPGTINVRVHLFVPNHGFDTDLLNPADCQGLSPTNRNLP